jgi:hypothetical protein
MVAPLAMVNRRVGKWSILGKHNLKMYQNWIKKKHHSQHPFVPFRSCFSMGTGVAVPPCFTEAVSMMVRSQRAGITLGVIRLDYHYPPAPGDVDHPGTKHETYDV